MEESHFRDANKSSASLEIPRTSWNRGFITVFTGQHLSLSWARSIYSMPSSHFMKMHINPLKPNDPYRGCTAPLTSKRCILYIYSTNICTEYFKRGIYSPFYSLQNAVCFISLTYLVPVLFTFYIQGVLKLNNSGARRLIFSHLHVIQAVSFPQVS